MTPELSAPNGLPSLASVVAGSGLIGERITARTDLRLRKVAGSR